jgi:putative spermidine/putrescine transport system ATP-binding protein
MSAYGGPYLVDHTVSGSAPAVSVEQVTKSYGSGPPALREVTLAVSKGEFVCVLGPSGSGKTTLLRILAGFLTPDQGRILADGEDITRLGARRRDVGVVFQHFALFPNMTAFENVAFPLRARRITRDQLRQRVLSALELVELRGHSDRRPSELSGGQQQRVALARALVFEPRLLLMDEPLSSLDRRLRQSLQVEIRRIQKSLGVPAIYVTHDQEEAMRMADRIVVLNEGAVEADGTPLKLYATPPTQFVASFLGDANLIPGQVSQSESGVVFDALGRQWLLPRGAIDANWEGEGSLVLRPEAITLAAGRGFDALTARVVDSIYMGGTFRVWLDVPGLERQLIADVVTAPPHTGSAVGFSWSPDAFWLVPRES